MISILLEIADVEPTPDQQPHQEKILFCSADKRFIGADRKASPMTTSVGLNDLNDHYLLIIVAYLNLEDLSSLAECSQPLARVARYQFAKRIGSNFVIDERVCGRVLRVFGDAIENITMTANVVEQNNPFTVCERYNPLLDYFYKKAVRRTLRLIYKYCTNLKNIHTALNLEGVDGIYSMSSFDFDMFVAEETWRITKNGENSADIINVQRDPSTSQPVLVDLNDKCWRSIMKWLDVADLTAMAECSKRMLAISRSCFAEQWTSSTFTFDYSVEPTTLRIFGDLINDLWILTPNYVHHEVFVVEESDQLKLLSLVHRYLPNVKCLRFPDVFPHTFGHPLFRELIRNVVTLEIGLWKRADIGVYVETMQCCTQLEHLWLDSRSMSARRWDCDEFLVVQYPNLRTLRLGQIVRSENVLLKFVMLHRNLESLLLPCILYSHPSNISRLKCLSKLKSFTFYGWPEKPEPTDDGIVAIYECLSHWTALTYLHIGLRNSPPNITSLPPMTSLTHCRLSIAEPFGLSVFPSRPYSEWIQSMAEKMPMLRVCEIRFFSVALISAFVSNCPQLDVIYCSPGFNTIVEMTENVFMDIVNVCRRYRPLQCKPLQIYICCLDPSVATVAISAVSNDSRINHSNIVTIHTAERKQIREYFEDFESSLTGSDFHGVHLRG